MATIKKRENGLTIKEALQLLKIIEGRIGNGHSMVEIATILNLKLDDVTPNGIRFQILYAATDLFKEMKERVFGPYKNDFALEANKVLKSLKLKLDELSEQIQNKLKGRRLPSFTFP